MQASKEVAGTGASSTGASSIHFTMLVVYPEETWLHKHQADPRTSYVFQDTDWAAEKLTGKTVLCTAGKHDSQAFFDARQSRIERGRVTRHCQTLAGDDIVVALAGSTARVVGWIIKSRDDVKANLSDLGTDRNGS